MEIEPASLSMLRKGANGKMVLIEDDVSNVARDIHEMDPSLRLRFSESGGYFVVYQQRGSRQQLVLTAKECDQRIVKRLQLIGSEGYDGASAADRQDREADRRHDHALAEATGERGEKLLYALRKDLGVKKRIYVPRSV